MPQSEVSGISNAVFLYRGGRLRDARSACESLFRRSPNDAAAAHLLGLITLREGDGPGAVRLFRRAVSLDPRESMYHANLGYALALGGEPESGVAPLRRAIQISPGAAEARVNLANALRQLGRYQESARVCEDALASGHGSAAVHNAWGAALQQLGQVADAGAQFRTAIALDPSSAEARLNHAMILLLTGDFEAGWAEYSWRWRAKRDPSIRAYPQPHWRGESARGRTLLLRAEQGYGDAIQFVRFAPMVEAAGATVVVECHPQLQSLLAAAQGVSRAYARGQPLGDFDLQAFMLDMPKVFRTSTGTAPRSVPYLSVPPDRLARARERMARLRRPLVGLAWAGDPRHPNDKCRSCGLQAMAPLWRVGGVTFVGVQVGPAANDLRDSPAGGTITDLADGVRDFADTAAILSGLDLLISVDTAVAHLAGALGRPVWIALPHPPDWRWLLDRIDSPWYPTAKLFRQREPGDWATVFDAIAAELRLFARHADDATEAHP